MVWTKAGGLVFESTYHSVNHEHVGVARVVALVFVSHLVVLSVATGERQRFLHSLPQRSFGFLHNHQLDAAALNLHLEDLLVGGAGTNQHPTIDKNLGDPLLVSEDDFVRHSVDADSPTHLHTCGVVL